MKDYREVLKTLNSDFPFDPTEGQKVALNAISQFLVSEKARCALIVKGYAGTGKTTLVASLVTSLKKLKMGTVLMAPTGRAAKVMTKYSGDPAHTIHKRIYRRKLSGDGSIQFDLAPNQKKGQVFIVDEASMIGVKNSVGAKSIFGARDLLEDLIEYVYKGKDSRLIIIGDSAQLPPVGSDLSPALKKNFLKDKFILTIAEVELTEVMRQARDSGILQNATKLREQIRTAQFSFPQIDLGYPEVIQVQGQDLQEYLDVEYNAHGPEGVALITRSNKTANLYNMEIRKRIFWQENTPEAGDLFMVVKNNYHWLKDMEEAPTDFIANGDIVEVTKIVRREEIYDFEFADVMIRFIDYPEIPEMQVKVLLDTLTVQGPNLPPERAKVFYHDVEEDYLDLKDRRKIRDAVFGDPYFNALQVKFAYAVTCHKAQGGQWPAVFIDHGYLTEDMIDLEFLRWLYTAFTRPIEKVYLINFSNKFFES